MFTDLLRLRARAWRYRFRLDRPEIAFLRSRLRPGDVVFDIGAHKGAYTWWMRRSVGGTGQVVAFEPQPELNSRLQHAVAALHWSNVRVEPCALSAEAGRLKLWVPGDAPSPGASLNAPTEEGDVRSYDVAVRTLDEYCESTGIDRVDFMKIDVEGAELSVFEGGAELLASHHPTLLFECETRHHESGAIEPVFDFLRELGYTGTFFREGRRVPLAQFDPATHQRFGQLPYANNFAFTWGEGGR